jgi:hypothetical protein
MGGELIRTYRCRGVCKNPGGYQPVFQSNVALFEQRPAPYTELRLSVRLGALPECTG